jgi:hypothetical protein
MGKFRNQLPIRLAVLAIGTIGLMNTALASPPVHRAALDLQLPPAETIAAEKTPTTFPSLRRRTPGGQEQIQPSGLGSERPQGRIPGRVEELALRFHREGLPIARLWENKSALVSLGLNQKGKPGLWFVQKTR